MSRITTYWSTLQSTDEDYTFPGVRDVVRGTHVNTTFPDATNAKINPTPQKKRDPDHANFARFIQGRSETYTPIEGWVEKDTFSDSFTAFDRPFPKY